MPNLHVVTFPAFASLPIVAGTSTRNFGNSQSPYDRGNCGLHVGDELAMVQENRRELLNHLGLDLSELTCAQQTHSDHIHIVTSNEKGRGSLTWESGFPDTDGMITNVPHLTLAVVTADCVPLLAYDAKTNTIAVAHIGKVGVQKQTASALISTWQNRFGIDPKTIKIVLGPAIHTCCYELDLPALVSKEVEAWGIAVNQIEISPECTSCHPDRWFSYRRDQGKTGRMLSFISLLD